MHRADAGAMKNAGRRRRGSAMIESAMAASVFLLLVVGILEGGRLGFAYNSVSFAAHRAARFAAVRGSASGHPATANDITAEARALVAALDPANFNVTTVWTPNNQPGSTVRVTVTYGFRTLLIPMSADLMTVATTSGQIITQ
jgi:Flp pilus assembly protein TadG